MSLRSCNAALAERLARELLETLPPSAKDAWLSAQDGCRCFLPYKVTTHMHKDPTDWESLRAATGVLRVVVPVVCDVRVRPGIARRAVETVLKELEIPDEYHDKLSIIRQAYKLRAMLSHLRRNARRTSSVRTAPGKAWKKHKDIMGIAMLMRQSPPFRKSKKNTNVTETQGGDVRWPDQSAGGAS